MKPEPGCFHWVLRNMDQMDKDWGHNWYGASGVEKAYRLSFQDYIGHLPEYPKDQFATGRGIVICGGGLRYLGSLFVTLSVIRHVGCTLPVEVWYGKDEWCEEYSKIFDRFQPIRFIDALTTTIPQKPPKKRFNGWELKVHACLCSSFSEVIFLDADCYPERNPEYLLDDPRYSNVGSMFFPDHGPHGQPLEGGQWERWGLKPRDEPDFESGQLLVNKSRCWKGLLAAEWLNDNSDYTYRHYYGDKSLWHIGFRATDTPYLIAPPAGYAKGVGFRQRDLDGENIFLHRCGAKFVIPGQTHFNTHQKTPGQNYYDDYYPHERFCHSSLYELVSLLKSIEK